MLTNSLSIAFLGQDTHVFSSLEKQFTQSYPHLTFLFSNHRPQHLDELNALLRKLILQKVGLVIIDLSEGGPLYLKWAKMFQQQITTRHTPVIGLYGPHMSEGEIRQGLVEGLKFLHPKGGDWQDVIHNAIATTFPALVRPLQVARASQVLQECEVDHYLRVGFVTPNYIHVESDVLFPLGQKFSLETRFKENIDTKEYLPVRHILSNLYYNFHSSFDVEYIFPHMTQKRNDLSEKEELAWKKQESHKRQKSIQKWMATEDFASTPKRSKILIIDAQLSILEQTTKVLDSFAYSFRFHQCFDMQMQILEEVRPGIIAWQLDSGLTPELTTELTPQLTPQKSFLPNNLTTVQILLDKIQSIAGYRPYVVLFACPQTQQEVQGASKEPYSSLMVQKDDMQLPLLMKMIESYQQHNGRSKTHNPKQSYGHREQRFYVPKENPYSLARVPFKVKILEISEAEMVFKSPWALAPMTVLRFSHPVLMNVTVVAAIAAVAGVPAGEYEYKGFLSGMGEEEKAQLRQYINDLFFRLARVQKKEGKK